MSRAFPVPITHRSENRQIKGVLMQTAHTPWWDRARHADRRPALLARNRIQKSFRDWFEAEGFLETDPNAMQVSPGNETHLHAFETTIRDYDGTGRTRYLHTSPEFAMKKLLAAGETRIFAFAHVWRNREDSPKHANEFCMLEWYRAQESYERLMDDCAALLACAAAAAGCAPRARACAKLSNTTIPAPSPIINPSRFLSNGLGVPWLLADVAPIFSNPPMAVSIRASNYSCKFS